MSATAPLHPTPPEDAGLSYDCAEEGAWPRDGVTLTLVAEPVTVAPAAPPHAAEAPVRAWAQRFAGQLAWNVVSEVAARGASLWLSFWCARALAVSTFGRFTFALALTQYLWLLGDASANGGFAAREIARLRATHPGRAARLAGRFLSLRAGAGLALAVLVALVSRALPLDADTRGALLGATVFLVAYGAFADWALRAFEDFRGLAFASLAAAGSLVASTLLWLPSHPQSAVAAALWGGSFGVAALVAFVRLRLRRRVRFAAPHPLDTGHWARSAVFSVGAVAGIGAAQAPLLAMGLLGEAHAGGLFGAAYRLVVAVLGVFSVLWWPLFPVLARSRPEHAEFRDALAALARTALTLALPAAVTFLVWPREVLTLAFGSRYADGAAALRVAAIGIPVFACSGLLEQACLAAGQESLRARAFGFAVVLVAGGAWLAVPALGGVGAALLLPMAYGFTGVVFAVVLGPILPLARLAREAVPVAAASVALAAAWLLCRTLGAAFLPSFLVGAALYAGVAITAGFTRTDARGAGGASPTETRA
ncbi:MAG: hypothetical protein U0704_17480 [Candidatus Eisenbacteria bacterium]